MDIDIRSSKKGSVRLPISLYTSKTLQRLTLANCVFLNVPAYVCLPSLKSLSLKFFTYADNASLPRFLSGCPNLEGLSVEQGMEDAVMDFTVVLPSLQRLYMSHLNFGKRGSYVIDVPSLKYLNITDTARCNLRQIENMPKLVEARVIIFYGATHKFLEALTSVQRLTLWLSLSEVVHPSGLIFNQLVHLELYAFTEGWWDRLTCMLQDSPKLRLLKLIDKLPAGVSGNDIPIGWKPPSSIQCLLHSLEAFEWIGYKGKQGDRKMAMYVLNNAACLKTATFSPNSTDLGEKYQILKELASVATASASSQLLFD